MLWRFGKIKGRKGHQINTSKLVEEDVHEIRKMIKNEIKISEIAKKYKVSETAIRLIKSNKNWFHLPIKD